MHADASQARHGVPGRNQPDFAFKLRTIWRAEEESPTTAHQHIRHNLEISATRLQPCLKVGARATGTFVEPFLSESGLGARQVRNATSMQLTLRQLMSRDYQETKRCCIIAVEVTGRSELHNSVLKVLV